MWQNKPTELIQVDINDVDRILALDENGISSLKNVANSNLRYFTITGVQLCSENFVELKESIVELKNKYWPNGIFKEERVVFHSRDIRKREYCFNPKYIDYQNFLKDLKNLIYTAPVTIYAATLDKLEHRNKYRGAAYPVYGLALTFILERYAYDLKRSNKKGIVMLESRGKKEDTALLKQIVHLFKYGNEYNEASIFSNIDGVFFNCKRTADRQLSYWQLELADLYAYPIHTFTSRNVINEHLDQFKNKIYGYPNHLGKGLKLFPKSFQRLGL